MSSLYSQSSHSGEETTSDADALYTNHPFNVTSILAAAGPYLPLLHPEYLIYDKQLDKGNTFEVNREIYARRDEGWAPYYVAVKHVVVSDDATGRLWSCYDSVMRELRVLTHPALKDNDSILPIMAYGWTNSVLGRRPYLVVDYSDHGTLTEYLHRIKPSLSERREFALDVAAGLKALHDSKIIHGDVKPSNMLVFDATGFPRSQMAKLADFGGSIFENDPFELKAYGGTAIYNAPEQEGRGRFIVTKLFETRQLYQADMYSFGITLWEIMKNGHAYIDETWLLPRESRKDFLNRICTDEINGVLQRAKTFCNDVIGVTGAKALENAVADTFNLTLQDDSHQRSNINEIIQALSKGANPERPMSAYPRIRINPPAPKSSNTPTSAQSDGVPRAFTGYKLVIQTSKDISVHKMGPGASPPNKNRVGKPGMVTLPLKPPSVGASQFQPHDLDIFRMALAPTLPWTIQCDVVQTLQQAIQLKLPATEKAKSEYFHACLQLALCYHTGFGVQPTKELMFKNLRTSLSGNDTTKALYHRIVSALGRQFSRELVDLQFRTDLDRKLERCATSKTYFMERIRIFQLSGTSPFISERLRRMQLDNSTLINIVERRDVDLLSCTLCNFRYSEEDLSTALCVACRQGSLDIALRIGSQCNNFILNPEEPSPLHWLIMFDKESAEQLGSALVLGLSGDKDGLCRSCIDTVPTAGSGDFFFSEHCLELFGTPLHWAVRTRNLPLVQLLVKLGADINTRWGNGPRFSTDVQRPSLPNMSPLDIAVAFHLPEIIEALIDLGAEWSGGSFAETHSSFACIGQTCAPFSRYIIHGEGYRQAMIDTINVLISRGFHILETDSNGYDPLLVALCDSNCETYVIEELLSAGAMASRLTEDDQSNAAVVIARNCAFRRYNHTASLRLIAPRVLDINALDSYGRNALHYAAIGGSEAMVDTLSNIKGILINLKDSRGQTALHHAATFGLTDVLSSLVQRGVDIEAGDTDGLTPIMRATLQRRSDAVHFLLDAGANPFITSLASAFSGTVLHLAAAGASSKDTVLRDLLQVHPELQESTILDAVDKAGWTALHKATYYGDYDGVDALLMYGANRTIKDRGSKTALDRAVMLLNQVEARGLGIDHNRVRQRGPEAVDQFVAGLKEIRRSLES